MSCSGFNRPPFTDVLWYKKGQRRPQTGCQSMWQAKAGALYTSRSEIRSRIDVTDQKAELCRFYGLKVGAVLRWRSNSQSQIVVTDQNRNRIDMTDHDQRCTWRSKARVRLIWWAKTGAVWMLCTKSLECWFFFFFFKQERFCSHSLALCLHWKCQKYTT